jgi:hypothetical protein
MLSIEPKYDLVPFDIKSFGSNTASYDKKLDDELKVKPRDLKVDDIDFWSEPVEIS